MYRVTLVICEIYICVAILLLNEGVGEYEAMLQRQAKNTTINLRNKLYKCFRRVR